MATNEYPRLCGGTFFTLVIEARQQRMNPREHYKKDCDGLTDPEVLVGLIKVINPAYKDLGKDKLKATVNNYKQGGASTSAYFPFSDNQVVSSFDSRLRNNYQSTLNAMIGFVDSFIDYSEPVRKDINLVRALVDLIQQDQSIDANEDFFIEPDGGKKKKAALGDLRKVCLPSFLLGVWHYVVVNRDDNSVGKATYEAWCPSSGGGGRKYEGKMGTGILDDLTVYNIDTKEESTVDAEPVDTVVLDDSSEEQAQQAVNNPLVFNFNQFGSNGTQIGHVENYYAGKERGT